MIGCPAPEVRGLGEIIMDKKRAINLLRVEYTCAEGEIKEALLMAIHSLREGEKLQAERDAAVTDIELLMKSTDTAAACLYCNPKVDCLYRGGCEPCSPKWRGQ